MANSGKQLERLVQEIEKRFLPEGFTISANEKVFDDGVQIAEFDIEVTGNFGSTSIKWLIECRDRPSKGPAPGSWIEQLVGRRDRFKFDKVTAVSTTGFSPGATKFAKQKGIELRSVDSLAPEAVASWFGPSCLGVIVNRGQVVHADVIVNGDADDAAHAAVNFLDAKLKELGAAKLIFDKSILVDSKIGDTLAVMDAWQSIVNQSPQMFDGIGRNSGEKLMKVEVDYINPKERYQIITNKGAVSVVQINFEAKLSVIYKEVPISQITRYYKTLEEEEITQSVHFDFGFQNKDINVALHNLGAKDRTFLTVHVVPSGPKQTEDTE